ncbi:MAG: hypothetical protein ACRCZF_10865 [Gemmataceae bacterium]
MTILKARIEKSRTVKPPPPKVKPSPVPPPPPVTSATPTKLCPKLTHEEKMKRAIQSAVDRGLIGDEVLNELPSPGELITGMVVTGAALAGLGIAATAFAATGVGAIIEAVAAGIVIGLAAFGIFTAGQQIADGIGVLANFFDATRCDKAQTQEDLDRAGEEFASGVAKVGVGSIMAVLSYFGGRKGVQMGKGAASSWKNKGPGMLGKPTKDVGLSNRGYRPKPGERSTTREQYRQQSRQERMQNQGLEKRGQRPKPGQRSTTREQWREQQSRQRAEQSLRRQQTQPDAHMHNRHGSQTTPQQHQTRVQTGQRPDGGYDTRNGQVRPQSQSSRFDSPQKEAEALGRAQRQAEGRLQRGEIQPMTRNLRTGQMEPTVVKETVPTNSGRYGEGSRVQRGPNNQPLPGRPTEPTGPLNNAEVTMRYNPTTGKFEPITGYPSNPPAPRNSP